MFLEATAGLSPCGAHRRLPVCCGGYCRSTPCVEATAGPPRVWMGPATRLSCWGSAGSALWWPHCRCCTQLCRCCRPHCRCCKQLCCRHSCAAAAGGAVGPGWSGRCNAVIPQCTLPQVQVSAGCGGQATACCRTLRCASTPTCCCRAPVPADTLVLPHSPQVSGPWAFLLPGLPFCLQLCCNALLTQRCTWKNRCSGGFLSPYLTLKCQLLRLPACDGSVVRRAACCLVTRQTPRLAWGVTWIKVLSCKLPWRQAANTQAGNTSQPP